MRGWTELVQQWGVPQVEALQLQKSIASLMREAGPKLGDLHWKNLTGLGKESRVLSEEALSMLQGARDAIRLREPGWCGEKGQGRWTAKKLLQWAAKELAASRRDLDLQFEDIQDWAQRETMERKMGDSLLRWLGRDKPPQHKVRHKVCKKQLADRTRQPLLGADRAMQRTELEMLNGTDIVREVEAAGAWHEAAGTGPESEFGPVGEEGGSWEDGWEDWDKENWIEGTGVDQVGAGAEARAGEPETEPASDESWWEVIYGSTIEGAARATELEEALQAFAATVEIDGAHGDGQLAKQLGDLGGQEGWRLGLVRMVAGDLAPVVSAVCVVSEARPRRGSVFGMMALAVDGRGSGQGLAAEAMARMKAELLLVAGPRFELRADLASYMKKGGAKFYASQG